MKITKDLIEGRINNFWGYGNLDGNVWFIGLEEGFGGNENDLARRLSKNKVVLDNQGDMRDVADHIRWF